MRLRELGEACTFLVLASSSESLVDGSVIFIHSDLLDPPPCSPIFRRTSVGKWGRCPVGTEALQYRPKIMM